MLPEASSNRFNINIVSSYVPEYIRNAYTIPRPAYSLTVVPIAFWFGMFFLLRNLNINKFANPDFCYWIYQKKVSGFANIIIL